MLKTSLFNKTRLQIAGWYAAGTGTILLLVSFYLYFTIRDSYWSAIDREVATLAGTLHDALEPKLQQPGIIDPQIKQQVIPNICIIGEDCSTTPHRHTLGVTQQEVYYLRFYNLQQQVIAQSGNQPAGEIAPPVDQAWQSIHDVAGNHYHGFSTMLTTVDDRPWGYLQVGRSMQEFDQRLTNLKLRMAILLPPLIFLIGVMSWWVAGRTIKPINHSYQKMQQFTADAAHELRTPLMAIQATVDLMKYYEPHEYCEQQASLAALDRQSQRLMQLAQDLLMLSHLDDAQRSIPIAPCCLQQVLPELIKNLQTLSQTSQVNLKVDLRTALSLPVKIDRLHLERLVTNLVANAIAHTPTGGTVTVALQQLGKFALLEVIDTGSGMSPATQQQIFDRFYRANSDRGRQTGGAGLGLSIVKSITTKCGGTVSVTSQLHQGSTFTVKLPLCS